MDPDSPPSSTDSPPSLNSHSSNIPDSEEVSAAAHKTTEGAIHRFMKAS